MSRLRPAERAVVAGLAAAIFCFVPNALAQGTKVRLSAIAPGTESVQLVYNGDFQFQGSATPTNTHPTPSGWIRLADMFADPGTNMLGCNQGVVARASAAGGAAVCQYRRTIVLEPGQYVLSAQMWNMGDAANHVTTVVDLNDAPGEPQITLAYNETGADQGVFAFRSFDTSQTGTNVTLRVFCDGRTGTGTAAKYFPVSAQWDNVAITRASAFLAPQTSGNLRPVVSLTFPVEGAEISFTNGTSLDLVVSGSDPDGVVTNVQFYAGAIKLGETASSPFVLACTNLPEGFRQLTAVATDNLGATTLSAPISVHVTTTDPPAPPEPALRITPFNGIVQISWPATLSGFALQISTNAGAADWRVVTNTPLLDSDRLVVSLPVSGSARYFRLGYSVDATTLIGKSLMGYQGWFACPNDGSPMNRWVHWFDSQTPVADNLNVDFWPDISECDPDELFATAMTLPDGSPAKVYSPWNQKTVLRHFRWMKDNNLDGVFLQRFTSELSNSKNLSWRNGITANVRAGAEAYGRVFAIMYDVSGQNPDTLVSTITNDWNSLAATMRVTESPRYLYHNGKPVVVVWGFGFGTRSNTPTHAVQIIDYFKRSGCTIMGGVPSYWRTLGSDAQKDPAWASVYRSFDVLSPWTVGRFSSLSGADTFKANVIVPDLAECKAQNIEYMPVVFPGFSWHNLYPADALNQIPRLGGNFYWRQIYNVVSAGCTMFYGAMFDELNEGTSMFKMAPTQAQLPVEATLVPLNVDGQNLPSDWYLRLADQAGKMLRREIPMQAQIPITP